MNADLQDNLFIAGATVLFIAAIAGLFLFFFPAQYRHERTVYCRSTMVKEFGVPPTHRIYWQDGRCVVEAE